MSEVLISGKNMDYKNVAERTFDDLDKQVNIAMKDGWIPSGAVASVGSYICQTMIRFNEEQQEGLSDLEQQKELELQRSLRQGMRENTVNSENLGMRRRLEDVKH